MISVLTIGSLYWVETTKVKGAQFLCSCKLLSFFRFWSKNGRRAHSLVGSLPQDWEGWRTSYLVCCNCWWQDQGEAWDCNQPCASNWVYSNILANWASPSSPQCASKGSPQPACSCTPGCPGWGSNQSFAGSSTPSPSSPSSFTTSWIWEAPSDGHGEDGRHPLDAATFSNLNVDGPSPPTPPPPPSPTPTPPSPALWN